MSYKIGALNEALKRYDYELYCAPIGKKLCVFKRKKRFIPIMESEALNLYNLIDDKTLVIALTDNWTMNGQPRDWGIDKVLDRLKSIDLANNARLIEEMDAKNEEVDESKKRALRNEAEAWASDARPAFKKAFKDVMHSSLPKEETRKILKDRSIKNGNY